MCRMTYRFAFSPPAQRQETTTEFAKLNIAKAQRRKSAPDWLARWNLRAHEGLINCAL
jgi:hypothetical protein